MIIKAKMMFFAEERRSFQDNKGQAVNYMETRFLPMDGTMNPYGFNVKNELAEKVAQLKPYQQVEAHLEITANKEMKPQIKLVDVDVIAK